MDKKTLNEEQFRKLIINEAKKYISEKSEKKINLSDIESLINEIKSVPKSISSILKESGQYKASENVNKGWSPNEKRDYDVLEHNKKKNINHVNEGEKDKWKRMIDYNIPKDEQR